MKIFKPKTYCPQEGQETMTAGGAGSGFAVVAEGVRNRSAAGQAA